MKPNDVYVGSLFVSFVVVWFAFMLTSPLETFLLVGAALAAMFACAIVWGTRRELTASEDE